MNNFQFINPKNPKNPIFKYFFAVITIGFYSQYKKIKK